MKFARHVRLFKFIDFASASRFFIFGCELAVFFLSSGANCFFIFGCELRLCRSPVCKAPPYRLDRFDFEAVLSVIARHSLALAQFGLLPRRSLYRIEKARSLPNPCLLARGVLKSLESTVSSQANKAQSDRYNSTSS